MRASQSKPGTGPATGGIKRRFWKDVHVRSEAGGGFFFDIYPGSEELQRSEWELISDLKKRRNTQYLP